MFRLILMYVALASISMDIAIQALTDNLMDLMYVNRIECDFNKDICRDTKCSSKFFNRTTKLATVNCGTVVPFKSIKVQSSLNYRFTGGYRQFAINIRNDWCKFTDGTEKSILLDVFIKYIEAYGKGNFNRKCPLVGNLSVKDLPMNAQIYGGQFLPTGDYYHHAIITVNGVYGLSWNLTYQLVRLSRMMQWENRSRKTFLENLL